MARRLTRAALPPSRVTPGTTLALTPLMRDLEAVHDKVEDARVRFAARRRLEEVLDRTTEIVVTVDLVENEPEQHFVVSTKDKRIIAALADALDVTTHRPATAPFGRTDEYAINFRGRGGLLRVLTVSGGCWTLNDLLSLSSSLALRDPGPFTRWIARLRALDVGPRR